MNYWQACGKDQMEQLLDPGKTGALTTIRKNESDRNGRTRGGRGDGRKCYHREIDPREPTRSQTTKEPSEKSERERRNWDSGFGGGGMVGACRTGQQTTRTIKPPNHQEKHHTQSRRVPYRTMGRGGPKGHMHGTWNNIINYLPHYHST